jgi:hypothetical protein
VTDLDGKAEVSSPSQRKQAQYKVAGL